MDIVTQIFEVFTAFGEWLSGAFGDLMPIFYTPASGEAEGQLTIIGVLTVCGLALSVALLIFNIIRSFLSFN